MCPELFWAEPRSRVGGWGERVGWWRGRWCCLLLVVWLVCLESLHTYELFLDKLNPGRAGWIAKAGQSGKSCRVGTSAFASQRSRSCALSLSRLKYHHKDGKIIIPYRPLQLHSVSPDPMRPPPRACGSCDRIARILMCIHDAGIPVCL